NQRLEGPVKVFGSGGGRGNSLAPWVKSGWPSTRLAAMPLENGGACSSTRLHMASATHRLPLESQARPSAPHREVAESGCDELEVNAVAAGWPNSRLAFISVVRGGTNSSTLNS